MLRGYRKINITVNCILPITPVILHGFPGSKLHSWLVEINALPAYIFFSCKLVSIGKTYDCYLALCWYGSVRSFNWNEDFSPNLCSIPKKFDHMLWLYKNEIYLPWINVKLNWKSPMFMLRITSVIKSD